MYMYTALLTNQGTPGLATVVAVRTNRDWGLCACFARRRRHGFVAGLLGLALLGCCGRLQPCAWLITC